MNEKGTQNYDLLFPLIPILAFVFGGLIVVIGVLATGQSGGAQPVAVEEMVSVEEQSALGAEASGAENEVVEDEPQTVAMTYDPEVVDDGRLQYQTACAACHGMDARGVAGLGKTLVASEFVDSLSDAELHEFIVVGRPIWDPLNTTGIAMPARGANPALTDQQIDEIVAYIRTVNIESEEQFLDVEAMGAEVDPLPELDEGVTVENAEPFEPLPVVLLGDTMEPYVRESIPAASAYESACANCHGVDGAGTDMWAGILNSQLIVGGTAEDVVSFLIGNPDELMMPTDGFPHPQRGGHLNLTDEEIADLVDYLLALE